MGRIFGKLAVSRSLGDSEYKLPKAKVSSIFFYLTFFRIVFFCCSRFTQWLLSSSQGWFGISGAPPEKNHFDRKRRIFDHCLWWSLGKNILSRSCGLCCRTESTIAFAKLSAFILTLALMILFEQKQSKSAAEISKLLVQKAFDLGSLDNISVIIVFFLWKTNWTQTTICQLVVVVV